MEESTRKRLEQLRSMTELGLFGEKAQSVANKWAHIPPGVPFALNYIHDFYNGGVSAEYLPVIDTIIQYIVIAYRDSKRVNVRAATALLESMIRDYPDIPD